MTYDYLNRMVHMPEKYFRKDRHIKLSKLENIVFSIMWFSRNEIAKNNEIYKRVYGNIKITEYEKNDIRKIVSRLRKKGIEIKPLYKYGYQLVEKD